jgi:transposase
MLKINISEEDKKILQSEVYNQFHPSVMRKMDALRLKSFNISDSDICKILDIHPNTLRNYFRQYMEGGIDRLKEIRFRRLTSDLAEYSVTIESYFIEHPPSSIREASAKISELTGVFRGESAVRKFLKSLNFKYRKTGSVPKDALTESKKKSSLIFWKQS